MDVVGQQQTLVAARKSFRPWHGYRTVLWGDSWASLNTKTSGTPNTYGGFLYYDTSGWFTWANYFLRQRLELVNNAGVTGQTTTQWLARWAADVQAYTPDVVFVVSPVINDVRNGASLATIQANITTALDLIRAQGALAVIFTCAPLSSPSLTTTQLQIAKGYNAWLKYQINTARHGVVVVDIHRALTDATAADDWLSKAIYKYTSDGTHPGAWGAARIGKLVYQALDPLIPRKEWLPHGSASINASVRPNLVTNSGRTGTGGTKSNGATGSVADSWIVQSSDGASFAGTVTCSLVDAVTRDPTDQVGGSWQQIAVTTAASKVQLRQTVTGWTAGGTVEAGVEFIGDSDLATLSVFRLMLQAQKSGTFVTVYGIDMASDTANGLPIAENPFAGGIFRTPQLIIPSDATTLVWVMQINGLGTWRIRDPACIKVN